MDVGRQVLVYLSNLGVHGRGYDSAVGPDEHHRGTHDNLTAVFAARPRAEFLAQTDVRHITHVNRCAVDFADGDFGDLLYGLDPAGGANCVSLALMLDVTATGTGIVLLERFDDVGEGQAVADQLHRVRLHVELLDVAADRIHGCDATNAPELWADDPVLHRTQVCGSLKRIA